MTMHLTQKWRVVQPQWLHRAAGGLREASLRLEAWFVTGSASYTACPHVIDARAVAAVVASNTAAAAEPVCSLCRLAVLRARYRTWSPGEGLA